MPIRRSRRTSCGLCPWHAQHFFDRTPAVTTLTKFGSAALPMGSLDFLGNGPRTPIFTGAPSTGIAPGVKKKSLLHPEPASSLWPDDSLLRPEDSLDKTLQTKVGKTRKPRRIELPSEKKSGEVERLSEQGKQGFRGRERRIHKGRPHKPRLHKAAYTKPCTQREARTTTNRKQHLGDNATPDTEHYRPLLTVTVH